MTRRALRESELDQFRQWIEHLRIKSKEIPIVVESVYEKRVLEDLGVSNIYILAKKTSKAAEEIAKKYKECALLLDTDKRGRDLYTKAKAKFEAQGVKIDQRFEQFVFHTPLKRIRSIFTYFHKHLIDSSRKEVEL
jgi:5S rRNA maturation endonuclease (ribonuclease M5)